MIDLEPILNALCNYHSGIVLDSDEIAVLSNWLKESETHQLLFKELGSWTRLYTGNIGGNPRHTIQERLLEMEEG